MDVSRSPVRADPCRKRCRYAEDIGAESWASCADGIDRCSDYAYADAVEPRASIPEWFLEFHEMPPFTNLTEFEREYRKYMASITVEQFHGIRNGDNPGEVIVLIEEPANDQHDIQVLNLQRDTDDPLDMDWIHTTRHILAMRMLRACDVKHEDPAELSRIFHERIIRKLSRSEWTLSVEFIRTWTDAVKETL